MIAGMSDKKGTTKSLLSVGEIAEQFGVSRATHYRCCDTGAIPSVKVAGTVRVPTRTLADRLARSRGGRLSSGSSFIATKANASCC